MRGRRGDAGAGLTGGMAVPEDSEVVRMECGGPEMKSLLTE